METTLALLETYKYVVLLPLAIVEGPIITILAGFLVSLGHMNPYIVYPIVVVGDVIGDSCHYALGRWGGKSLLRKIGPWLGVTDDSLKAAREYFGNHHYRALTFSKIIHGIGFTGLITAGTLGMPFGRFLTTCAAVAIVQSAVYLLIGIFFGHAYALLGTALDYFSAAAIIGAALVALFLVLRRYGLGKRI